MSQGLQIWNSSGQLILDTSDRVGRILGVTTMIGGTPGSVTNPGFEGHEPFWIATALVTYATYAPLITFSANTLSWSWPTSGGVNHTLVYGAY